MCRRAPKMHFSISPTRTESGAGSWSMQYQIFISLLYSFAWCKTTGDCWISCYCLSFGYCSDPALINRLLMAKTSHHSVCLRHGQSVLRSVRFIFAVTFAVCSPHGAKKNRDECWTWTCSFEFRRSLNSFRQMIYSSAGRQCRRLHRLSFEITSVRFSSADSPLVAILWQFQTAWLSLTLGLYRYPGCHPLSRHSPRHQAEIS